MHKNLWLNLTHFIICLTHVLHRNSGSDPSGLHVWDVVLTCPWRVRRGPAAGWGPRSGQGTLWLAALAGPPSASVSCLHLLSRFRPPSVKEQCMLGVCLHFLVTQCSMLFYLDVVCQAELCVRVFRHLQDESWGLENWRLPVFLQQQSDITWWHQLLPQ